MSCTRVEVLRLYRQYLRCAKSFNNVLPDLSRKLPINTRIAFKMHMQMSDSKEIEKEYQRGLHTLTFLQKLAQEDREKVQLLGRKSTNK